MCGITGIIRKDETKVNKDQLIQLNDLVTHRGPDGSGIYIDECIGLGHKRLAILDLTVAGSQPMIFKELVITYNGEIYNYLELRKELEQVGYEFKSDTDTEVILSSYDYWGDDCVQRFNGMWSFAIYDKKKNRVFCSRDRFGIKPFYYKNSENEIIFGSEIKQLLEKENFTNIDVLLNYFMGIEQYSDKTFFNDILELRGGHNLIYCLKDKSIQIMKYYTLGNESLNSSKYQALLEQSISYRLRSDVTVGSCLSGGLDSSTITAIASIKYKSNQKFSAIHAKSTEKDSDESKFAQDVADKKDINLYIVKPSKEDFISSLEKVVRIQEEPFGGTSVFMQHFVMKEAASQKIPVLLDGQGGDETLLGYERYYVAILNQLPFIAKIKMMISIANNSRLRLFDIILYYIYFNSAYLHLLKYKKSLFFVKESCLEKIDKNILLKKVKSFQSVKELQKNEILHFQLPHLLRYEDKNSMAYSIETRLPFLDYSVVEKSLQLEVHEKVQGGWTKFKLREVAAKWLPEKIAWRKNKLGFNAPEKSWIDSINIEEYTKNSHILSKILKHNDVSQLSTSMKWKIVNIAVWEKEFNVKLV